MRRRLLLVTTESNPPPYNSLRELYGRLLPERGWDVDWVLSDTPTPGARPWSPPGRVFLVPSTRGHSGLGFFPAQAARTRATALLRREVRQRSYDAVQVRDDPLLGSLFSRACAAAGRAFLFQVSHLKEEEAIGLAGSGLYGHRALQRVRGEVALRLRSRVLGKADAVLAISDAMAGHLARWTARVSALPEGVPAANLTVERRPDEAETLVYVGTLNRTRRLEVLFPVLAQVGAARPRARLLIVGGGLAPGDRPHLEEAAAAAGVRDRVEFRGPVPLEEIPGILAGASIGLSPLPDTDVFRMNSPIKLIEYLAAGLPVVATHTPEQDSVIRASVGGYVVDFRPEAIADAVLRLLEEPDKGRSQGQSGRAWVAENRTFEILVGRLTRLLEGLVSRQP